MIVFRSLLVLTVMMSASCQSVRPVTRYGHDLLENSAYDPVARTFAGIGSVVGHVVGFPIAVLLIPSCAFDDAHIWNADGYPIQREGDDEDTGDFYIPLVQAPFAYGSGVGSAVFGWPVERLSRALVGREFPPPPPPGTVVPEIPEAYPGD